MDHFSWTTSRSCVARRWSYIINCPVKAIILRNVLSKTYGTFYGPLEIPVEPPHWESLLYRNQPPGLLFHDFMMIELAHIFSLHQGHTVESTSTFLIGSRFHVSPHQACTTCGPWKLFLRPARASQLWKMLQKLDLELWVCNFFYTATLNHLSSLTGVQRVKTGLFYKRNSVRVIQPWFI